MFSPSYGGIKAEEKPGPMSQSGISGYLQGISSYIPSSIKTTIKKQIYTSPSIVEGDKDTIVGTYFDECEILGKKHKLLTICYNNGFQIWDLDNPDGVREIFSLREGMTRFVKVLTSPAQAETPNSVFYGKRPLLAVVSGEDNPKVSRNMVRIFSLRTTELVNMNKFRTPVYNILSNDRIVLVCLKERIVGFDPVTMTKLISLPCYPSVSASGVVALGPRWIAYTDSQPMLNSPQSYFSQIKGAASSISNGGMQNQSFDNAVDVATDIAKDMAQKLYYISDIGRKKVTNLLYPDDSPPSSSSPAGSDFKDYSNGGVGSGGSGTPTEGGNVVIIYDFIKHRNIAVIRPTSNHPISYLTFDPSGTLLFSCSTEGTKINVYQIIPYSNSLSISSPSYPINLDPSQAFRQIYVLKRGITNASIQSISVSDTSKWVAVTSSRGTTHIYAINPLGGDVSIHTHISKNHNQKKPYDFSNIPNYLPSVLTLNSMDRIKLSNTKEENPLNKMPPPIISGNSSFVESTTPNFEQLYVVNQNGQLLLYELRPQPPVSPEMDPNTLCLSLTPSFEWDICRKTRQQDFKSPSIPYNINDANANNANGMNGSSGIMEDAVQDSETRWLYNVEITTHSQEIRAIWGVPQFSFRNSSTYKPSPDSLSFFDEDYPVGEVIKFEKKRSTISSPRADFDDGEVVSNIMINNHHHNGAAHLHHHYSDNNHANNNNNNNNAVGQNGLGKSGNGIPNHHNNRSNAVGINQYQQQQQQENGEMELMKQLDQAIKTPLSNGQSPKINSTNNSSNNAYTNTNSYSNNNYNLDTLSSSPLSNNVHNFNSYSPSSNTDTTSTYNQQHHHNLMKPANNNNNNSLPIKSAAATSIHQYDNIYGLNDDDISFGKQNELLPVPPTTSTTNNKQAQPQQPTPTQPVNIKKSTTTTLQNNDYEPSLTSSSGGNTNTSTTSTTTTNNATNNTQNGPLYPPIPTVTRPTPPPTLTAITKKPSLSDFDSVMSALEKTQPMNVPASAAPAASSLSTSTSSSSGSSSAGSTATSPKSNVVGSPKGTNPTPSKKNGKK
ncbi:hypothetical protein DFA_02602 [Cavenderia fasciculata]|uniref:BCAS3 WD40 domain-containing protein n=1 Tax=Cavenderia fasciculata TaxID=261658 RepID=F4PZU9_CACFS|nr:uncharacterized protein DFA_02602 [Cavenderia fasciculata]EGG18863.1 hypothetical protein DFA_02602 [Cavenderia fasciculata]|eukprot:XP_004357325.1 hypothetical protein DFA_02602 [Cavenderia fasciculata]